MNAVIPGVGIVFVEPGDGAQALDKLPATMLLRITQSITLGAGEYFMCNAWVRRVARRAAQSAQRQAGNRLSVSRMVLIKIAPVFFGPALLPFWDFYLFRFCSCRSR